MGLGERVANRDQLTHMFISPLDGRFLRAGPFLLHLVALTPSTGVGPEFNIFVEVNYSIRASTIIVCTIIIFLGRLLVYYLPIFILFHKEFFNGYHTYLISQQRN